MFFHKLLSLGCINFKNLCAYHCFQNAPNIQSLHDFKPSYGTSKKAMFWLPFSNIQPKLFWDSFIFWNCYNFAQNHPNFSSWGCFGNLRASSWWWAHRSLKLIHSRLSNSWKTSEQILVTPTVTWFLYFISSFFYFFY